MSEEEISLILNTYMYIDYREADDGMSVSEIVKELSSSPDCREGGIHYEEYQILAEAAEYPEIGTLIINQQSHLMGYDFGTAACSFQTPDQSCTYIVYRGTSDGEWPDNGVGMTQETTIQQQRALSYFETSVESLGITKEQRLIVTGHSKGGNKAQYVIMSTKYDELTDACYSVDGQGFSEAAIEGWTKRYGEAEFEKRRNKITGICGENDYVNVLGYSIVPENKVYYIKTPTEKTNFAGYHDIKYLFAKQITDPATGQCKTVFSCEKNPYALQRGVLGDYAAQLSEKMMELPKEKRDGCAAVIMHLMEMTGGDRKGINNEKLTLFDVDDFLREGTPLIADSLFLSTSGISLLRGIFEAPTFGGGLRGDVNFAVQEQKLRQQADSLQDLAEVVKKEAGNLTAIQERLGLAMKGEFNKKQKLLFLERELKKIALTLEHSSMQLIDITKLYRDSDRAVFNS